MPKTGDFVRTTAPITFKDHYGVDKVVPSNVWGSLQYELKPATGVPKGTWAIIFFGCGIIFRIPSLDLMEFVPKDEWPPTGWVAKTLPMIGHINFSA